MAQRQSVHDVQTRLGRLSERLRGAGLETWGYRGVYRNVGYEAAVKYDITVGENGSAEVTSAVFGGDFTVEMTPESGYSVNTLTINGRDYSTFGGYTVANEGGVVTVSFENWGLTHADVARSRLRSSAKRKSGSTSF